MLNVKSAKKNNTSKQIEDMMDKLRSFDEVVIVPTYKTNSYKPLNIKVYCKMVTDHLLKSSAEIERSRLIKIHENAVALLTNQTVDDQWRFLWNLFPNPKQKYPNSETSN